MDISGLVAGLVGSFLLTFIIIFVVMVILGFVVAKLIRGRVHPAKLLQTGTPAQAKLLDIKDMGSVGKTRDNPLLRMTLEVHSPTRGTYQTVTTQMIPRLQAPFFQVGAMVQVRIDPKNPKKVAVAGLVQSS